MKNLFLLILTLFFFSCTNNHGEIDLFRLFKKSEHLNTGEKISLAHFKGGFLQAIAGDSLALFLNEREDTMFTLYRLSNGSAKLRFGLKGNGPQEFILPMSMWLNEDSKTFTVYDAMLHKLFTFSFENLEAKPRLIAEGTPVNVNKNELSYIAPINDTLFLYTGGFEKGIYELIDQKNNTTLERFGQYPTTEKEKGLSCFLLGTAYQGKLYANPDGERVVCVGITYGAIDFLGYSNGIMGITKSYLFHPPKFEPITASNGAKSTCFSKENKMGFIAATVSKNNIYALYSGRTVKEFGGEFTYGRKIFVFDWDGNPVKCYELNRDAFQIAVDSEDKSLYVLFVENDYSFEKFQLSGL